MFMYKTNKILWLSFNETSGPAHFIEGSNCSNDRVLSCWAFDSFSQYVTSIIYNCDDTSLQTFPFLSFNDLRISKLNRTVSMTDKTYKNE